MLGMPSFSKREWAIFCELMQVIQASLDPTTVAPAVFPLLNKLIAADHFALAVSRTPDLMSYDWSVADMPSAFFRDYDELAHLDFVRLAVAKRPNLVLTDGDILAGQDRALVQRNPFYQATRSHHMPVEQVLAVMIAKDPSWIGGLTLYRDKAHPFTPHERDIFQFLTEYFAIMMSNGKRFANRGPGSSSGLSSSNLEWVLKLERTSVLIFDVSWRWIGGSNDINLALYRCFGEGKRAPDGLPPLFREYIKNLVQRLPRNPLPSAQPMPWIPARRGSGVVISFVPVVKEFGMQWLVFLDEVPALWRAKLSPAEIDVAVRVAQGWDNALVAKELGLRPSTIPTHLNNIYKELGIEGRETLIANFRSRN